MTSKQKTPAAKLPRPKRVVTEIAPGVRVMLDAYRKAYNEGPDRVSSPLQYTDIINQALDAFLPARPASVEAGSPNAAPAGPDASAETE